MEKFRKVSYFDQCSEANSSAILSRDIIKTLKCSRESVAFLLLLLIVFNWRLAKTKSVNYRHQLVWSVDCTTHD